MVGAMESEPAQIDLLTQVCDPALDRLEAKDLCHIIIDTIRTGRCPVLTYSEVARRHNETLRRSRLLGSMLPHARASRRRRRPRPSGVIPIVTPVTLSNQVAGHTNVSRWCVRQPFGSIPTEEQGYS